MNSIWESFFRKTPVFIAAGTFGEYRGRNCSLIFGGISKSNSAAIAAEPGCRFMRDHLAAIPKQTLELISG